MKIDRHNYEEFFILYWDDELTAVQKQAVENFVQENTDLQEEFKILCETRFTPVKNIQFEEKDFLHTGSLINITNYEEELLNYIDDELTPDQRKEVEKFADKLPAVQQELALLQRTKLQPEAEVIFPNKSVLYRREEKVRVISMTWFRVAVAAAILLIAGLATIKLVTNGKNDAPPPVASVNDSNKPSKNQPPSTVQAIENKESKEQQTGLATVNDKPNPVKTNPAKNGKKIESNISNSTIAYTSENKNNLPKEGSGIKNTSAASNSTEGSTARTDLPNVERKKFGTAAKNESDAINASLNNNVTLQHGYALNIQTPAISESGISEKEGGGIKEFLRKTTRVFERRTRINTTTDDNKLLVGAFAVSLK